MQRAVPHHEVIGCVTYVNAISIPTAVNFIILYYVWVCQRTTPRTCRTGKVRVVVYPYRCMACKHRLRILRSGRNIRSVFRACAPLHHYEHPAHQHEQGYCHSDYFSHIGTSRLGPIYWSLCIYFSMKSSCVQTERLGNDFTKARVRLSKMPPRGRPHSVN